MAKVKTKSKSALGTINKILSVILVVLLVFSVVYIAMSSAKVPVAPEEEGAFVDEVVIDEFKAGTYGGQSFQSVEDVVAYYNKCYDYTKTLTAEYDDNGVDKTLYKLLGEEQLNVENLLVEGNSNATINKLVPGIVGNLFKGGINGLSPSGGRDAENDLKNDGKSNMSTSHLTAEDVLMANVTDNGDGTITLMIQPKAAILSMPDQDSQGRFFNVLGDISGVVSSISILSFSEGTVDDNFVVNYAGGTGTIVIDTKTGEITTADYNMKVHIDVKHANVTVLKDKSASLDIKYDCHFPASDEYLSERGFSRK